LDNYIKSILLHWLFYGRRMTTGHGGGEEGVKGGGMETGRVWRRGGGGGGGCKERGDRRGKGMGMGASHRGHRVVFVGLS
jgi:hypothetical protein